ncbi:hypothetical protein GW830_02195 [bacterium]|nr:hypothetical protein [bacterium]
MDSCSGRDYSPSYYDGTCGTAPVNTSTGNIISPIIPSMTPSIVSISE